MLERLKNLAPLAVTCIELDGLKLQTLKQSQNGAPQIYGANPLRRTLGPLNAERGRPRPGRESSTFWRRPPTFPAVENHSLTNILGRAGIPSAQLSPTL